MANPSNKSSRVPVAVAWYYPAQWERLKEIVDDPQNFEETHAEWQGVFDRGLKYLKDSGFDAHKVPVDVDELAAWCKQEGCSIDGAARSNFAAEKLRERYRSAT